jgi:hypothetical protein
MKLTSSQKGTNLAGVLGTPFASDTPPSFKGINPPPPGFDVVTEAQAGAESTKGVIVEREGGVGADSGSMKGVILERELGVAAATASRLLLPACFSVVPPNLFT